MKYIVRHATSKDLPAIQILHKESFECIGESENNISLPKNEEENIFVAEGHEGQVVGYSTLKGSGTDYYCGWMGVTSRSKETGAGSTLLQALIAHVRSRSGKSLSLDTRNRFKPAIRLYLKNGFDIISTYEGKDGELMIKLQFKF